MTEVERGRITKRREEQKPNNEKEKEEGRNN